MVRRRVLRVVVAENTISVGICIRVAFGRCWIGHCHSKLVL